MSARQVVKSIEILVEPNCKPDAPECSRFEAELTVETDLDIQTFRAYGPTEKQAHAAVLDLARESGAPL